MSEWLGKPKLSREDIAEYQPSMEELFPLLVRYFVDDQKFRMTAVLSYDIFESFKNEVIEKYGKFTSKEINEALEEAIKKWIDKK